MSIPWSRSLYMVVIICACLWTGCARSGLKEQIDTIPPSPAMDNHPARVLSPGKSAQGQQTDKHISLASLEYETNTFNNQSIFFAYDSSDISDEAIDILKYKIAVLQRHPQFTVQIEGHCDEWGTIEYNLALGDRRACAARDFMIESGIDPQRIQTISYGKERPLDPGHSQESWAKNRRDRFTLIKP